MLLTLLLNGSLLDLPADNIVLELHKDVVDSSEVRFSIAEHRTVGFRVALDAVTPGDPRLSLAEEVDFVKVDVAGSGQEAALELIAELCHRDVLVIAEKVEEPAAFDELERPIRSDLTLADRFPTMIASAAHRWGPVSSVRDGMIGLGHELGLSSTELAAAHVDALSWGNARVPTAAVE